MRKEMGESITDGDQHRKDHLPRQGMQRWAAVSILARISDFARCKFNVYCQI